MRLSHVRCCGFDSGASRRESALFPDVFREDVCEALAASDVTKAPWKTVSAGGPVRLRLPADISAAVEQSVDSTVAAFAGDEVSVVVDHGPFSDPLTGYGERGEHRASTELIAGRRARVVSFLDNDTTVVAAHFPETSTVGGFTVVARARSAAGRSVAEEIVRGVTFSPSHDTEATNVE